MIKEKSNNKNKNLYKQTFNEDIIKRQDSYKQKNHEFGINFDKIDLNNRISLSSSSDEPKGAGQVRESSVSLYTYSSGNDHIKVEDFMVLQVLGRGNFSKVHLVYLPEQDRFYAIKVMRKDILIE